MWDISGHSWVARSSQCLATNFISFSLELALISACQQKSHLALSHRVLEPSQEDPAPSSLPHIDQVATVWQPAWMETSYPNEYIEYILHIESPYIECIFSGPESVWYTVP